MKKLLKVLAIVGLIIVALIGICFAATTILSKEKTPISAAEFNNTMKEKGYAVADTTNQFAQYGNYVSKSYAAQKSGYQIEFYELSSEENAISMFDTNKARFESQKSDKYTSSTRKIKNYSIFSLTTNGKYQYLSRIDNTLIYVDVDESYKDTVKDLMKEIGY